MIDITAALKFGIAATAAVVLVRQCRKPRWWVGQVYARVMNSTHDRLTNWGLDHLAIGARDAILDVGCGGGATIQRLRARAPQSHVSGVDYSDASVAVARQTNSNDIAAGTVDIQQASVSHLPFPDNTFNVVTGVETHYYWPNLAQDLAEVRRVLKPGGRVANLAEAYAGMRFGVIEATAMRVLGTKLFTMEEHRQAMVGYLIANPAYVQYFKDYDVAAGLAKEA